PWQFGGNVGGPIFADQMHFFLATDWQQKSSAFGNAFQISGTDAAADRARAGFDASVAQHFTDLLSSKYGITNVGTALPTNLDNPDRNFFAKIDVSAIENSHLELSYNYVNASTGVLIRSPLATRLTAGNLRDGYELSNSGYNI